MLKVGAFAYTVFAVSNFVAGADPVFKRGDANNDGAVNGSDLAYLNDYLFNAGDPPSCMDAADVNDDGTIDISDSVYLGNYLSGGEVPPAPFPDCGADPTGDGLSCDTSACS